MNETTRQYWDKFCKDNSIPPTFNVQAEQFGTPYTETANELGQLIIQGEKTAASSVYILYQLEGIPMPNVGLHTIVLDSEDNPLGIIKTTEMTIIPMNKVPPQFALDEGDLSYEFWYNTHKIYFENLLKYHDIKFTDDILLVCERFQLIDVKT